MTQTKAHYSKWTLPVDFATSFLPQPSERLVCTRAAAWKPLCAGKVGRRGCLWEPLLQTLAGSGHPTSAYPSPHALTPAYSDIASYGTTGT